MIGGLLANEIGLTHSNLKSSIHRKIPFIFSFFIQILSTIYKQTKFTLYVQSHAMELLPDSFYHKWRTSFLQSSIPIKWKIEQVLTTKRPTTNMKKAVSVINHTFTLKSLWTSGVIGLTTTMNAKSLLPILSYIQTYTLFPLSITVY